MYLHAMDDVLDPVLQQFYLSSRQHCRQSRVHLENRLEILHFTVLCSFYPCRSRAGIAPRLFAPMEAKTDRISIIAVFLWSEKVGRQTDNTFKRLIGPRICLYTLKKRASQLAFLVVKVLLQAAMRLSLTLQKRRVRAVRNRSVLTIERGVVLTNQMHQGQCTETSPNKTLRKRIQDQNLTLGAER